MVEATEAVAAVQLPTTSIESGYALAPVADDIVDGSWRYADDGTAEWTAAPVVDRRESVASPSNDWQPGDYRTQTWVQERPSWVYDAPAPQPAEPIPAVEWSLPSITLRCTWLDSLFDGLLGWLSLDWLIVPMGRDRSYDPVGYVFFAVPSALGGHVHYYLMNVCKLKVASESYTDDAEFCFSVPVYQSARCERALKETVGSQWRRMGD